MAQSWRSHSPAEHVLLLSLFPPLENRGSNSTYFMDMAFQMVLVIENMPANVGDIREAASIHGILQARLLEWVAMPSSRESS